MKVYNFFMYNGEEDILDIRLNTLENVVDYFVIGSSEYSHSGIYKGISFIPVDLLEKYKKKIIFIEIPYTYNPNPWVFEQFSREFIYEKIKDRINPDDIIYVSDLDEISDPIIFYQTITNLKQPVTFCGRELIFCLDLQRGGESHDGLVIKNRWKKQSINWIRSHRTNFEFNDFLFIPNSSYHFSSVGTPEQIAKKMSYFAHSNEQAFLGNVRNPDYIRQLIINKCGGFDIKSSDKLNKIDINILPKYVINNQEKFKHLFYSHYV